MKTFIVIWVIVSAFVITLALQHKPKYVYPVRENIVNTGSVMTWDQYCWSEYADGKITKKFLGTYRFEATVTNDTKFTFSSCSR